jgi:hypothetical protein
MAIIDLSNLPSLKKVKAGRVWEKTSRSAFGVHLSLLTSHFSLLTSHLSPLAPCLFRGSYVLREEAKAGAFAYGE